MTYERPAPFTHDEYARQFAQTPLEGATLPLRVQVLKRGVTYCGTLRDKWTAPNGLQCWSVDTTTPEFVSFTVPCRNVVLCPDDGFCTCRKAARLLGEAATAPATCEDAWRGEAVQKGFTCL